MTWKMGPLTLGDVPVKLRYESNRLMNDPLISIHDTEDYTTCLPLRSRTEHDSDRDEHDDAVTERNTEDE